MDAPCVHYLAHVPCISESLQEIARAFQASMVQISPPSLNFRSFAEAGRSMAEETSTKHLHCLKVRCGTGHANGGGSGRQKAERKKERTKERKTKEQKSCVFFLMPFTGAYARPTFCLRPHSVGLRAGQSWDRLPTRPTRVELLLITAWFCLRGYSFGSFSLLLIRS